MVKHKNNEHIVFPAVYSSSSYGTKDLLDIFEYSLNKATKFYKEYNHDEDKISNVRLNIVNNILCSAYLEDIGIPLMYILKDSLVRDIDDIINSSYNRLIYWIGSIFLAFSTPNMVLILLKSNRN